MKAAEISETVRQGMERIEAGMMAQSRAGHDRGTLYLILKVEGDFLYLSEGRLRPKEKPKKKRQKHVQVIRRVKSRDFDGTAITNEEIKYQIKMYKIRRETCQKQM